jgi:hypothetical protein
MELLQLYGIPLPVGLVAIIVICSVLYVVCMRFLDNKASVKSPKAETAPINTVVNTAFTAPNTGNSAIVVAISAAVNEYRKNN